MSESTCLHIQDRESGPIRVVELPWISVRIGRAAYCEVRLPDEQIGDEACRLTRRGRTWSIVPAPGQELILFDGRPLTGPCPVPFDVPFRIGPYCLTLRNDVAAEPDWEMYPSSAPSGSPEATETNFVEPEGTAGDETSTGHTTEAPPEEGPVGRGDPDRWRARWKAAEAHFKARNTRIGAGDQRGSYPTQTGVSRDAARPAPRTPSTDLPSAESRPRPVPSPAAPRIEPTWSVPRPGPAMTAPPIGPSLRAVPPSAVGRREPIRTVVPEAPYSTPVPAADASGDADYADLTRAAVDLQADRLEDLDRDLASAGEPSDAPPPATISLVPPSPADEVDAPPPPPTESEEPSPAHLTEASTGPPPAPSSIEPEPGPEARPFRGGASGGRPKARTRSIDPGGERTPRESSPPGQTPAPHRPIDRGARKRRPPRERVGLGRRGESASRPRPDPDRPGTSSDREGGGEPGPEAEWPAVRDILANHRSSPGPRPAVERRRKASQAIPTVPQEPGQWILPGWLALPPVGACVLSVGFLAFAMSWWWAIDSSNAAVVTQQLLSSDGSGRQRPLPAKVVPPGGRWVGTTAQHLAHWGIYLAWAGPDEKIGAAEAPSMLGRALEVSPLNPTARLAMAQLDQPGPEGQARLRDVGLSRDSVSLAWSARRLLAAGKKETALRLYGRALSAAAGGGLSRTAAPRSGEDSGLRRFFYFLPAEDSVRDIVAELAAPGKLEFREWSTALPHHPVVLLATARLLREQGSTEADALLDRILSDEWTVAQDLQPDARLLAARAEALVLRSRWREAAEQYRRAIERVDNDLIRRSWWFNLADIAQRLQDEPLRQAALRSAVAVSRSDEITRHVSVVQKAGASKPPVTFGSAN